MNVVGIKNNCYLARKFFKTDRIVMGIVIMVVTYVAWT